jgi:hypothetical protein
MITAAEKGRKLHITVGDEDDNILIIVEPVNGQTGTEMFKAWLRILNRQRDTLEADSQYLGETAVGEANKDLLDDLRSAEQTEVINSAIFWQIQGGGIKATDTFLEDGLPKATQMILSANGFGVASDSTTSTSPAGESVPQTATASTGATTSPAGTDTLSKLPPQRKSIGQNQPSK